MGTRSRSRGGRPHGSTSGRVPRGGYPAVSDDLTAFLAGFLEGEATFSVTRQTKGQYRCAMTLGLRRDDEPLLNELAGATRLGTMRRIPARATSHPQSAWTVRAKSDCLRLSALLDAYPLRGRKSRDYAVWRAALRWWIAGDPTKTIPNRDWTPMAYLKERLHQGRQYTSGDDPIRDSHTGLSADWPWFLSGFFTAEGYLGIYPHAPGVLKPVLVVRLRKDDRALLSELRERTATGRVYLSKPSGRQSPVAQWLVFSAEDLLKVVHIFDRYPPKGRKGREYEIWREAAIQYAHVRPARLICDRLYALRLALRETRTYRPTTAVEHPRDA